jgi:endo-1,4-beta-xylanase
VWFSRQANLILVRAALILLLVLLSGCGGAAPTGLSTPSSQGEATMMSTSTPLHTTPTAPGETLRALADRRGLAIGAAVDVTALRSDMSYAQTLAREFNILTAENVLKFGPLRPARDRFDFSAADELVQFAQNNNMQVRGHTLVWHNQLPDWLTQGFFSREELSAILKKHIQTVVERYRGRVAAWDVVNEAVADNGQMRDTLWLRGIGPNYLDLAFQWAHEADPQAKLFYNDYNGEGLGSKSDAIYRLLKDLLQRGVPVQGVGLQMHISLDSPPRAADIAANIQRLGELGLEVHITEMDVRARTPASAADLERQAAVYRSVLGACLDSPYCKAFVLWGFTDRYSWIPGFFQGYGSALIFDEAFAPKPAYQALKDGLAGPPSQ